MKKYIFCPTCKRSYIETKAAILPKCPDGHEAVHIGNCYLCAKKIGYVCGDDYSGPEVLICNNCLEKYGKS